MKLRYILFFSVVLLFFCSCATSNWDEKIYEAKAKMDSLSNVDSTKNTWNLRDDADFEVMVSDGVWWVPANTLGKSRYTNEQIASIVNENPRVKKVLIGNLYEAIQLYQISDFDETNDNIKERDSFLGKHWEKHKPGYYAVYSNQGCCATDTNWLIYLLNDDYDGWGTVHFQRSDGSGHVFNYFYVDGYYYFIDMTHYRNDFNYRTRSVVENGNKNAYRKTDFILANIHKAITPEAYVNYFFKSVNEQPSFFYLIKGHEVPDLTSDHEKTPVHMILDSKIQKDLVVIYIDKKKMSYGFYQNTTSTPNWAGSSRHPYKAITDF